MTPAPDADPPAPDAVPEALDPEAVDPEAAAPDPAAPADLGIVEAALMTALGGFIDAYLFLHHGVFAFAQTGNVIFLAVAVVQEKPWLVFLWPLLAYIAGISLAHVVRAFAPTLPPRAIEAVFLGQIAVFTVLALLPASAPAVAFVVPLAVVGGIRLQLFRSAGGITFVSIATTGNFMRLVDSIVRVVKTPTAENKRLATFALLIVTGFIVGAFAGAAASKAFGAPAIWGVVAIETAGFFVYVVSRHRRARLPQ